MNQSPEHNIETEKRLRRIENRSAIESPRTYIRTVCKRLIYIHHKTIDFKKDRPITTYQDEEIDALFWLLAHFEVESKYDVAEVFDLVKGGEIISKVRYAEILLAVR